MQITKFRSGLFFALEQMTVHLQRAQNTLTRLVRTFAEKRRRLQEALREREDGLRKLLASSPDAIVVTNGDHRFVAANPNALQLFGVSETNIRQFTIDAFLPGGQILDFDANGLPFMKREERHGKCRIRRLDGSLRIAEYTFVTNFAGRRHLSRFQDVTPEKMKFIAKFDPSHGDIQPAALRRVTAKVQTLENHSGRASVKIHAPKRRYGERVCPQQTRFGEDRNDRPDALHVRTKCLS
jgi:PAS domain S-box-containing protein